MTSSTEDNLDSDLIDGKVLETLIIGSVRTLKQGNKKRGREERCRNWWTTPYAMKFVRIFFNKPLDSLIEEQFIKCNIISSRKCLSIPKGSELHHRSIQDASSVHEYLNPCPLLDSGTNKKSFPFKEAHEKFKV